MKDWISGFAMVLAHSLICGGLVAQAHDAAAGAQIFSTNCAGCHGGDARGGERAPNIATVRAIVALSTDNLEAIVTHGVPGTGMPAFRYMGAPAIGNVVAYLRELQGVGTAVKVSGDPQAGHALFYGKAGCARCHMVRGEGGFVAPDLSDYGLGVTEAAVRRDIVDPDHNLQPESAVMVVRTDKGEELSGVVRAEDNFNLTLQTEDGQFHMLPKSGIALIRRTGHSLMPHDYGTRLSRQEIQDLVSFLMTSGNGGEEGRRSAKGEQP